MLLDGHKLLRYWSYYIFILATYSPANIASFFQNVLSIRMQTSALISVFLLFCFLLSQLVAAQQQLHARCKPFERRHMPDTSSKIMAHWHIVIVNLQHPSSLLLEGADSFSFRQESECYLCPVKLPCLI